MHNRWRYAGKEEQRFGVAGAFSPIGNAPFGGTGFLDLSLIDFGARMYDPFIVRWTAVDPLAIKFLSSSTSSYCIGNPIRLRDPDGNDLILYGIDGTSITVKTDLVDWSCNLNINWGGTFEFSGKDALVAVLDVAGIFDQTGFSDALNASIQWSEGQHFDALMSGLSVIPAVGDLAKLTRAKKDAEILGIAYDAIYSAGRLNYLRRKAVKEAWKKERELVLKSGAGTRAWTELEIEELKRTGKVKGYEGHHINNVKDHPELAGEQRNVMFVKKGKEHLNAHGGNYRNETHGPLISR